MYALQAIYPSEDSPRLGLEPESIETHRKLIVDDDLTDRTRIRRLTHSLGLALQLEEASNLNTLRQQLDTAKFDVILLDYHLGAHDGLDAIRLIRNHRINALTPVVMVAGAEDIDTAVLLMKSGANDFLAKGKLNAEQLSHAVMEVLGSSERQKDTRSEAEKRVITDAIMTEVSKLCFGRMRTVLMRTMRQVRTTATVSRAKIDPQVAACLHEVEKGCGILLTYFDEFEGVHRRERPGRT